MQINNKLIDVQHKLNFTMQEILFSLLEQSPMLVFAVFFFGLPAVLSVVIYFLYKKLLGTETKAEVAAELAEAEAKAERKAHKKELKLLNEKHENKVDELNSYNTDLLKTLDGLNDTIEDIIK